ncbi:alpha/beta hydrolase [Streptomyces sp. NBRC 14336]|uniref:alpha/beta fold hydrolase n=1 Tax=Streptomyces sp. NBRC 14336 TaxID=3030992 RepID=UPI0024A46295|nr:alpha/beta hydrolase [Streptomyces sp. NBRC 14336]WBO81885.1 alpha/beta hydrolase [Streptomyces sp. SBE_14.2]GLW46574.1 alpha/beta hydrolase [Streptomyces sp. NBRC 14336]
MSTHDTREPSTGQEYRGRLLAAMPLTERRIKLGTVSTAVLEGGDGPPVVLLHGQGEFAAVWLMVIPDLVRTYRVIVPDLPGHGESVVNDGLLDSEAVMTWLDELIDRTCRRRPPVLVGHLLGGAIAARYAVHHSHRIARLVLVDTMGLAWFRPAPSFALPMVGFVARPTAKSRDRVFKRCFLDMEHVGERTGEQWEPLLGYALDRARTPSVQAALRTLIPKVGMRPIASADLTRIDVPTDLIHGRHDLQVRLRTAQAASARYGWPLQVIEDCRDDPAAEQPEAFLRALRTAMGESRENGGTP